MLPSGNDAAIAIGEWGGKAIRRYSSLLMKHKKVGSSSSKLLKSMSMMSTFISKKKSYMKLFVHHMNKLAKAMNLHNTNFVNAHGLMNEKAYSTALDVCKLSMVVMENPKFKEIVNKQ